MYIRSSPLMCDIMLTSTSGNGLPSDLEFTLGEISTELAKLGVKETSPTRLAAIKADLDRLIARDLETLSISLNKEASINSPHPRSNSASFSSYDASTITSDSEEKSRSRSSQLVEAEEYEGNGETTPGESSGESNTTLSDSRETVCSGSIIHRRSADIPCRWPHNCANSEEIARRKRITSSSGTLSELGSGTMTRSRWSTNTPRNESPCSSSQSYISSTGRRINGSRTPLQSSPLENSDYGRSLSSRRPSTAGRSTWRSGGAVNRGDPVSLWRLYNRQWERQSRATAVSERALRWSVKAAMAVREVPLLASSRRSLYFSPSSQHY
ncbi:hypothetical protein TcWFU_002162 [Taenia crassiceps]|uniref:Uncharacterized protein n=1 Tax=Taenia crassiceps TaxID=6207 RepID=A0ABR4Q6B3_9CEST